MDNVKFLTVESVTRLRNSGMGNPVWRFTFTDGTFARTSVNTSFAYEVVGDGREDGRGYSVTFTRAGYITNMRRVAVLDTSPSESGVEFTNNRSPFTECVCHLGMTLYTHDSETAL